MRSHNRFSRAIHQTGTCAFVIVVVLVLISANTDLHGAAAAPYHAGVIDLWGGGSESIALRSDGTVWTWGALRTGDACCVPYDYGPTPVQVAGIDHVTLVRARDWHVLARKSDGTVWAWGWNLRGQIGDGTRGGDKETL